MTPIQIMRAHAAFLAGAIAAHDAKAQAELRDSAGIRIVDNRGEPVPRLTLIAQPVVVIAGNQGDPDLDLLRVPSAFRRPDGTLVVAEGRSMQVRIFDRNGRLLRRFGRPGDGPGEFRNIAEAWRWRGDSILVSQLNAGSLTVLSATTGAARTIPLRGNIHCCFADGGTLVSRLQPSGDGRGQQDAIGAVRRSPTLYERFTHDATSLGQVLVSPGPEMTGVQRSASQSIGGASVSLRTILAAPFGRITSVLPVGDAIIVADASTDEIRVFTSAGKLRTIIRIGLPVVRVTDADVDGFKVAQLRGLTGQAREIRSRILSDLTFPMEFPAYRRVEVDWSGGIWAEQFHHEGASEVDWLVFDPDGRIRGRVAIPVSARLLSIGLNEIVLRSEDPDGFINLSVHRIVPSPPVR